MIAPNFEKFHGLVPAIIQDAHTQRVLMLGFMNEEAWTKTYQTNRVTFYSRTKKRLWTKGEESGNFLHVKKIQNDCDNDTLLISVEPEGPVCHTGADTCFNEINAESGLGFLEKIIADRKATPSAASYTSQLLTAGINKAAQKVGEEAVELIIEAKDSNDELFLNEAADLMYHYLVLLAAKNFTLSDVEKVLRSRHKK